MHKRTHKCWGKDLHGKHVTLGLSPYGEEARCTFCGHRVGTPLRKSVPLRIMDWPGEIVARHRARRKLESWPKFFMDGVAFYE